MKAVQIFGYSKTIQTTLRNIPQPEPLDSQVLIQVKAAAVNPLDLLILTGSVKLLQNYPMPLTLGNECSGIVAQVGRNVTDFRRGDRVYTRLPLNHIGAFAEYVAGRYVCYGSLPEHLRSPLAYFRALLEAGVQFDVVGIQLYFPARDMVMVNRMLSVFASLGKPIHITEMGVSSGARASASQGGSGWSQQQLSHSEGSWHGGWSERTQADWMEQFYTIAASRPELQALTWWDFMEPSFSGNGAFLFEDETPKEMYFRLLALKKRILKS